MNRYRALRAKQQKEVNEFPILFAFSKKQLLKELKKRKAAKKDLIGVTRGGYILKKDRDAYVSMMLRHKDEVLKALDDPDCLYDMFRSEMEDHGFFIGYNLDDALQDCPVSIKEMSKNPLMQETLKKAEEAHLASCP